MMLHIPDVLTPDQVALCRERLAEADWADGRATAGYQSARAKNNQQLPEHLPVARQLGALIVDALKRNATFMSAALPRRIFPPLFNCYDEGQAFGVHVDNALRFSTLADPPEPVRTDLSVTLFLSAPEDYDGGELVIEDTFGPRAVKLPAGHLVLYPGTSLHKVTPITRGARLASFFWVQSLVRDDAQRSLMFDLDLAIQRLNHDVADHPALVGLVGVYHNLLRQWAEV